MEPVPVARGEKRWNGLIGVIRIAPRVRPAVAENLRRHEHRLMVDEPIE